MRHLGLFPAPALRITSAPTVSACSAHNSDKTVRRLITTHSARAHMHARTTRGTYRVRNSNHAGGTPPYATQASGLPTRHAHLAAHWVPSVRNTEIGIGPTNWQNAGARSRHGSRRAHLRAGAPGPRGDAQRNRQKAAK
jgi:hypothetical protein